MPLPCGFSNMHGMPMRLQMLKSEMENRKRQLPAVTAACWCAGSPGTPKGCERLRSGPPFLMFCIDVKVVQGGAKPNEAHQASSHPSSHQTL